MVIARCGINDGSSLVRKARAAGAAMESRNPSPWPGPQQIAAPQAKVLSRRRPPGRFAPHGPLSLGSEDAPFDQLSICCHVICVFPRSKRSFKVRKPHFSGVSHHTSSVNNAANLSHAFWQAKSLKPNRTASHLPKSHRERTLLFIINIISQHTPCPLFAYGAGPDATDCSEFTSWNKLCVAGSTADPWSALMSETEPASSPMVVRPIAGMPGAW